MEVQFGPNPVDEPNLLYKLQRKIKVFNTIDALPNRGYNLVASSSKYGIVFVGALDGTLSAYHLKELIDKESEPKHLAVKLSEKPTHLAVNCDQELLAITGGQLLCIYKVADFKNVNVAPAVNIKLDASPSAFVSALQWNPCIPDNIAVAFFDGTLLVSSVYTSQVKKVQSKARCICWSPKGKQLVTGNSDGSLCQYKPDLTLAKAVPPPNLFEGAPVEALAIYWISNYQFAVVFRNASDNSRPSVTVVNTPKAGQPSCWNYEDICYSMGSNRPWYYYLLGLPQWNIILASSSNSMEIATLGSTDGANWTQWCQTDEARPELPLTDKKIENYPVGLCIDVCGIHQLPWGENETLPHMPLLHVVSQSGLLTIFNIINMNKAAPQICIPPQQLSLLALPANALTSDIPDDAPAQVTLSPPPSAAAPKPQPQVQPPPASQPTPPAPQPVQSAFSSAGQVSSMFGAKPFGQTQQAPAFSTPKTVTAPVQQPEPAKQPEVKPVPSSLPTQTSTVQPKPQQIQAQAPVSKPPAQAPEVTAALKAEQERLNKSKADQELKNMLVKEVNDFQMELYKFVVKSREMQNKIQQDLNSIDTNFNFQTLDTEQLKKECDLEELRNHIVQLKLELVRTCAVVAEARTHANAKDHEWTQIDPLTVKRVASVKNLAYYVQTQLEQAHRALDYKWNEMLARDPQLNKPGQRMIRPILDDVYQPLVKQQEILSRQQAVLRTLKNTLKEIDPVPMFKSTTLLRSTPFRNKDPLSKLTKNILNMSIEPQNKPKELFTPQKIDALRDMLSNHKPAKIKPINIELRQHWAQLKMDYEKSLKGKEAQQQETIKSEPVVQTSQPAKVETAFVIGSTTVKPAFQPATPAPTNITKSNLTTKQLQINVPSFTPLNQIAKPGLSNVARTLFTEDPNKSQQQIPSQTEVKPQVPQPVFNFSTSTSTALANTKSILKDMLTNKQANQEMKNDANTFMGQKICSPSAFAFSTVQSQSSPQSTISFTSKPISDINNTFSKFTPQSFAPETKPQMIASKPTSSETGAPTKAERKPVEVKKNEENTAITVQIKGPAPLASSTPVPEILKSQTASKAEKAIKPEKAVEKSKENIPDKNNENTTPIALKVAESEKKDVPKAFSFGTSKSTNSLFGIKPTTPSESTPTNEPQKPVDTKTENKPEPRKEEKKIETLTPPASSSASSIFAAANAASPTADKPQPLFGTPTSAPPESSQVTVSTKPATTAEDTKTTKESTPSSPTSSPSSIFASAASSQPFPKTTPSSPLFSAASTGSNGFTSTQGSIFGTTTTTTQSSPSVFGTSTAQSIFSSVENKPTVFSTPIPASPAAVFGAAAATSTTTSAQSAFSTSPTSLFGTTTTQAPAFGSSSAFATPATTATPVFGGTTAQGTSVFGTAATTVQSVFGATTTTTPSVFGSASSSSIFGQAAATTQASVFGSPATTAQSVFGSSTPTTQASIFGSATTTTSSIFGAATPTTQQSVFGSSSTASVFGTTTPATPASVFGTPTVTQSSVFGSPTTTQTSVFGTPTATTQASVFGTPPATTAGASLFGATENLFASASISTTNAASPTSGGSIFGGGAGGGGSTGSVFGGSSNTNVFGGKSSFSQSNPQAAAIFGGGSSFGQKPASNFWSGGGTTGGTGFGSTAFGQTATTQPSSIFGGSTGGNFSAPSDGQPFGSPQQQTSVFGSPQQQSASAFGGSPVFGTKPAFGQPPAFGSPTSGGGFGGFGGFNKSPGTGFGAPATFGGAPSFGAPAFGSTSPGKVFGGSSPTPNFGTTQSNATFEQLATQNTLTFGNLAQQTTQQAQPAPSFNTSPSFTGWRG